MPCGCGKKAAFKYGSPKTITTAAGDVTVARRYDACRHCRRKPIPWDDWAGVGDDHLAPGARQLVTRAGASWSHDMAEERLKQLCGISVSGSTIRRVCDRMGMQAAAWLMESVEGAEAFRSAEGQAEFYTDGVKINTREGGREMRIHVFAKRPVGTPVPVEKWDERVLPETTARLAFGSVSASEWLGRQWATMASRLGGPAGRGLSVLADGAKWIWNQADEHLPDAECGVDVYHVSEHLHGCGRVLHGDQTPEARAWADQQRRDLMQQGPIVYLKQLAAGIQVEPRGDRQKPLQALRDYLTPNVDRLGYQSRLARGLPIGSGLVEGACKTLAGRRLKLNNARWRPERADHMLALCSLLYGNQWKNFWAGKAA